MDLRRAPEVAEPPPDVSGARRARRAVQLPEGMSLTMDTTTGPNPQLVIRRRWMRTKHWFLLILFAAAGVGIAYAWGTTEPNVWLILGTVFVATCNYNLIVMFVNSTTVSADADGVTVRHGPIPSWFARNAAAKKADIAQLYATRNGALFAVEAGLKSGQAVRLVAPLVTAEQALFVEQQLERVLGILDFPVPGELADGEVNGKSPAGAKSGAGLAISLPALILVGSLSLAFFMAQTEVSGSLRASGTLGSWVFEPDDCTSGQRDGFGGVTLTASAQPGHVVRVVRDPVRGNLVVVASQGRPNHVLNGNGCARFDMAVQRTSTKINDIWAVDGSLTVECEELSGAVTFEGCH